MSSYQRSYYGDSPEDRLDPIDQLDDSEIVELYDRVEARIKEEWGNDYDPEDVSDDYRLKIANELLQADYEAQLESDAENTILFGDY